MKRIFRRRFFASQSDNRQSKIENLKLVGIFTIGVAFVMCGAVVEAQQPKKVPRIGFLGASSASVLAARIEAFRQGLSELGYVGHKRSKA